MLNPYLKQTYTNKFLNYIHVYFLKSSNKKIMKILVAKFYNYNLHMIDIPHGRYNSFKPNEKLKYFKTI